MYSLDITANNIHQSNKGRANSLTWGLYGTWGTRSIFTVVENLIFNRHVQVSRIDNHSAEWVDIGYIDNFFSFAPQCTTILRILMLSGFQCAKWLSTIYMYKIFQCADIFPFDFDESTQSTFVVHCAQWTTV